MQVKSVSDCLNIIDDSIVEKIIGISNLENIHKYLLEKGKVISSKIGLLYQMCLVK